MIKYVKQNRDGERQNVMDAQLLKKHSVEVQVLGEYETSFAKKYLNPEHSILVEKLILYMDLLKSVFEL